MHKYGLNVRYLGILLKRVDPKKSPHLIVLFEKIIYVKCLKNIINSALKNSTNANYRQITAHILNCVFYPNKIVQTEYHQSKNNKE